MTLLELTKKTLALIEELNTENEKYTDDPDIALKLKHVINQVLYRVARIKKIPKYVEMQVEAGDLITFEDIARESGYEVYQLASVQGVNFTYKADGTVIKILESGTLEIDCYVYPERITDTTPDSYEFEISQDVFEILPYGIAADLLKSDVSAEYGSVYAAQFESMLQQVDPRYHMATVYIEGGVSL